MKTCVIIPTYNESKSIAEIISLLHQQNLEVVIVDDGSSDDTAEIAGQSNAAVIRNPQNQGKGAALIKGFEYALSKGFEAVITMDGDGQHLPKNADSFIRIAQDSKSQLLIGNRMQMPSGMPLIRQLTNRLMSWFISALIKQKVPDTQCGFRLIKKNLLKQLKLNTNRYETETEILIKTARLGYQIKSIPIESIYRHEKSQINPLVDTYRFIRFIIKEKSKKEN